MTKTVLLASAAIFALSAGASAATHPTAVATHAQAHQIVSAAPGSTTLYDQNNNDNGVGLVSQNFESTFDAYDAQAADDFQVPSGHKWKVKEVDVTGVYFNGSGPATSVNIFVYKNKGGLPNGAPKVECDNLNIAQDNGGSFVIKIPKSCKISLKAGTYWLSVQANLAFSQGGEWGWEGNAVQTGNAYAWQNPGGGFGLCTTWGTECLGYGPDFMFALKGKDAVL
jgi:hypothetical protein